MSYKYKTNCLKYSAVAIFMLLFQGAFTQSSFSELDKMITEKQKIIGQDLVLIIAKKDSIVYQKAFGAFNAKTVAPVASCSKWLTAALIMQLVDEGKLSLDDMVSKYLPIFESYGKNYITIRHCLSHMTGIQSEPIRIVKLLEKKKFNSLEEEVNEFAKKEIQTNPGTEFRYSDIGLNIAGRVAEIVTKKKFDLLIRQRLFVPLGMRQTTFSTLDGSAVNPSGGAKSTAADYSRFLQMMLNNGSFNGLKILSEAAVLQMKKIHASVDKIKYAPKSAEGFLYALGSWSLTSHTPGHSPATPEGGTASVLSSPGLFGTWPMVDYCRGYTAIFFVKNFLGEQKADVYLEMKKLIDKQFKNNCGPAPIP